MTSVTGTVPLILYNEIEDNDNLVAKGTDIDVVVNKNGKTTELSAVTVGNGKWEIEELDDAARLFPEYDPGDIISLDVLKKAFAPAAIGQSREILSFNLLGKIKYGLKDAGDAVDEKAGKIRKGLKKIGDWFTDTLDKETAQNYLRQYYPGANVGDVAMTLNQDGKYWKVLFGVPSEGKFYVLTLYRNGNDIRTLDDDDYPDTPILSFTDGNAAMEAFKNYPNAEDQGEEGEEFTEEEVQSALGPGKQLIDFETIEDESQKYEGLPTAVAICSMLQDDGNGQLNVLKVYKKDGKIWRHPSDNASFLATKQNAGTVVQQAIKKYKEFGGKKDLSYLLQGNSQQAEEEGAPTSGTTEDGIEWEIAAALRRKKSKWNGKNVTGYEEGSMFEMADAPAMAVSSRRTFSKLFMAPLFSTLEEFVQYVNSDKKKPFNENVVKIIKLLAQKLSAIPSETRKKITENSKNELALNFNGAGTDHYTATIKFYNDRISIICPAYSGMEQEDLLEMILQTLDSLAA